MGVQRRRLADARDVAQRLGRHGHPVADAAAGRRPRGRRGGRRPRRRGARSRCRPRSAAAIGAPLAWQIATASASAAWSGRGQLGQRQQRLHHPLHLVLGGAAGAAHRGLDLLGRVGRAAHAALAGGQHRRPRAPGRPRTPSGRSRRSTGPRPPPRPGAYSSISSPTRSWMAASRAPGVLPRGGLDHPAVERDQAPAVVGDDAVAGVGDAGIDAEDDHVHGRDSARRPGRLHRAGQRGPREAEEPDPETGEGETDGDDHHGVEHAALAGRAPARPASSASRRPGRAGRRRCA